MFAGITYLSYHYYVPVPDGLENRLMLGTLFAVIKFSQDVVSITLYTDTVTLELPLLSIFHEKVIYIVHTYDIYNGSEQS